MDRADWLKLSLGLFVLGVILSVVTFLLGFTQLAKVFSILTLGEALLFLLSTAVVICTIDDW